MSKFFGTLISFTLLALCCAACGQHAIVKHSEDKIISGCACDAPLPESQLIKMASEASAGDIAVEKKLWDYYVWRGQYDKAAPWEMRLMQAGDTDAIGHRADMLFAQAYDLKDNDPKKLSMIRQSLALERRWRKAAAGRVLRVMVNGKYHDIYESGEPDEGTRNEERLLACVQAAQEQR